jgi:hypothetical protein
MTLPRGFGARTGNNRKAGMEFKLQHFQLYTRHLPTPRL